MKRTVSEMENNTTEDKPKEEKEEPIYMYDLVMRIGNKHWGHLSRDELKYAIVKRMSEGWVNGMIICETVAMLEYGATRFGDKDFYDTELPEPNMLIGSKVFDYMSFEAAERRCLTLVRVVAKTGQEAALKWWDKEFDEEEKAKKKKLSTPTPTPEAIAPIEIKEEEEKEKKQKV